MTLLQNLPLSPSWFRFPSPDFEIFSYPFKAPYLHFIWKLLPYTAELFQHCIVLLSPFGCLFFFLQWNKYFLSLLSFPALYRAAFTFLSLLHLVISSMISDAAALESWGWKCYEEREEKTKYGSPPLHTWFYLVIWPTRCKFDMWIPQSITPKKAKRYIREYGIWRQV